MSHELYRLLSVLDEEKIWYELARSRPGTVMIIVTLVGERVEIEVFDDGHIEFSRFVGDERVESGDEAVASLYKRLRSENLNPSADRPRSG